MDIKQKIERYKKAKNLVRFERSLAKTDWAKPQTGYILACSERLVLFYEEEDFAPRSLWVFPSAQLSSVRHGQKEKLFQRIIDVTGTTNQFECLYPVTILDWQTTFESLKEANVLVTLKSEYDDKRYGWDFAIGQIVEVFGEHLTFRAFSVLGQWDEPVDYPYHELTQVGFGDRYSLCWGQYLTNKKLL
jgi:hypothetical protein